MDFNNVDTNFEPCLVQFKYIDSVDHFVSLNLTVNNVFNEPFSDNLSVIFKLFGKGRFKVIKSKSPV